ncbi:MAG TPA: (2Fe-2S)-binding protein [Jatrophihabitans sp.]|jgi:predicted molibdopterin-dependent oxidoreductase YjgC|uniref:(2Fe-2S)-binding protein n=1 Tax=Jatrophihabitans sp. TaxID=1932789 RepID=UPI002F1F35F6
MTGFTFDDREIDFTEGQTVGAALINAGIYSWRVTRRRATRRGLFCGIGVCYDCLISVNGAANQRACQVRATPGMTVSTQTGTGHDDLAC